MLLPVPLSPTATALLASGSLTLALPWTQLSDGPGIPPIFRFKHSQLQSTDSGLGVRKRVEKDLVPVSTEPHPAGETDEP